MGNSFLIKWVNKPAGNVRLCGELLVIDKPISFLGDVNPDTGLLLGKFNVRNKILVIPYVVGSTVGSYVIYGLKRSGNSPSCIITCSEDPVTLVGSIISNIPLAKLRTCSDLRELLGFNGKYACIINDRVSIGD